MSITYKPLWKLLIDRDMTREELRIKAELSPATIAKLGKDGNVTTMVLDKICRALDCQLSDIATVLPKETKEER